MSLKLDPIPQKIYVVLEEGYYTPSPVIYAGTSPEHALEAAALCDGAVYIFQHTGCIWNKPKPEKNAGFETKDTL